MKCHSFPKIILYVNIPSKMTKVAPIAVYTSGKGSSAAGLTASVIRDPSTVISDMAQYRVIWAN